MPTKAYAGRGVSPAQFGVVVLVVAGLVSTILDARGQHTNHQSAGGEAVEIPVVFLDKSPRIVAYQLGRLSNVQLLRVERATSHPKFIPVYEAILARTGMDAKSRLDAAGALAKLRASDPTAEMIGAIRRIDGENSRSVLADLGQLLAAQPPAQLQLHRADLESLAGDGSQPAQREAAFATLITFLPAETLWGLAEQNQGLQYLLGGVALQPAVERRGAFAARIEALLQATTDPPLLRAAIAAAVAVPGRPGVVFSALSRLFAANAEPMAVVEALQRMPKEDWPLEHCPALAASILDYARKTPTSKRADSDYLDVMQLGQDLATRLPPSEAARLRQTLAGLGVNIIRLRTLREQMFFDKTLLVAEAGQPVAILLENTDAMQHNLVVTAPGSLEEVGAASEKLPPTPDAAGRLYVPESPKVLYATRLLNPGESTKLEFVAPATPGRYPYACTYPGHWLRMRGILLVVSNLAAYLEQPLAETSAPKITEWKLADFNEEFRQFSRRGNPEKGKAVFSTAGCIACHRVCELGAVYGPDLTQVFSKYKQDPQAVLGEIFEPSKNIEPRYRNYNFKLADGDDITGLVVAEERDSVTIQTGPSPALIRKYPKKEIQSREAQELSVMPSGLLNVLSKEQILDLLAFLASSPLVSKSR